MKYPQHMEWAYRIARAPESYPRISRVSAFEAIKTLRLEMPKPLIDWDEAGRK